MDLNERIDGALPVSDPEKRMIEEVCGYDLPDRVKQVFEEDSIVWSADHFGEGFRCA